MKKITLFTGGSRSGKSRHAMNAALKYHKRAFIATAPVCDEEMEQRIAAHRAERGDRFTTIEEPTDIAAAIASVPPETEVILLDCLTVWAGNLMHKHNSSEVSSLPELEALFNLLSNPPLDIILVTNEVGSGIIPANVMARQFRDLAGTINQKVAEKADTVILCVSGIPLTIKGTQ